MKLRKIAKKLKIKIIFNKIPPSYPLLFGGNESGIIEVFLGLTCAIHWDLVGSCSCSIILRFAALELYGTAHGRINCRKSRFSYSSVICRASCK